MGPVGAEAGAGATGGGALCFFIASVTTMRPKAAMLLASSRRCSVPGLGSEVFVSRATNPEKDLPPIFHSNINPNVSFPYIEPVTSSSTPDPPSLSGTLAAI